MTDSSQLNRALVQKLESLRRGGVGCVPRPKVTRPTLPVTSSDKSSPDAASAESHQPAAGPALRDASSTEQNARRMSAAVSVASDHPAAGQRAAALQSLADDVAACRLCQELASTRKQTVFGVGNPNARLLFFGEAPGADEDRQGEPFVGKAGQLLTKIIEACTLKREDVYIMNVLKCRPPGNRNPAPLEAENCRPFFERQLAIIQPECICCLGSIAASTLLDTTIPVGRLRGKFHEYGASKVVVTYHPAYLLRNAGAKKLVWADMKMLMKEMGIQL